MSVLSLTPYLSILHFYFSGDCDTDDECGEGLICFQRGRGDAVPGCLDGEQETSNTDFCVPEGYTLQPTWESTWEPTFFPTFGPIDFPDNTVPTTNGDDGASFADTVCGLIGVFC